MIQRFENKRCNVLRQAPIHPKRHLFKRKESHQGERSQRNAQRNKPGKKRLKPRAKSGVTTSAHAQLPILSRRNFQHFVTYEEHNFASAR